MKEYYKLRTCYINFAEHLQNTWNVNFMYSDAPGAWDNSDWSGFIKEIKAFGFNNLQFWIPPTLCTVGSERDEAVKKINEMAKICHVNGITINPMIDINTIGAEWYMACPNDKEDRKKIFEFWTFYAENLKDIDIYTIFPGDPGGCNRNGCDHTVYLKIAAELAHMLKSKNANVTIEVGTWGTPFTGWGEDMRKTPNWDGTYAMLVDPNINTPEIPNHIWNRPGHRVEACMRDMIKLLPRFPEDTIFSLNLGFNPDAEPNGDFDARSWTREIAKTHRVNSWDYCASEGELICYPHYRVEKYKRKRIMEVEAAPYHGAICYTMTPKLSLLMLYCSAQLMINPYRNPDEIASEFSYLVFDDAKIGNLMKAFEIVPEWGYESQNRTKDNIKKDLTELIERLKMAEGKKSKLPVFPDSEEYRKDLLWHAENFLYMLGDNPDREKIRKAYREKALKIYEYIPKAVDERCELAEKGYSNIGNIF